MSTATLLAKADGVLAGQALCNQRLCGRNRLLFLISLGLSRSYRVRIAPRLLCASWAVECGRLWVGDPAARRAGKELLRRRALALRRQGTSCLW